MTAHGDAGEVFELHLVSPQANGTLKYELSGRFALSGRFIHVLLDRHGHLEGLEGPLTSAKERVIAALDHATYYAIVRATESWEPDPDELGPTATRGEE